MLANVIDCCAHFGAQNNTLWKNSQGLRTCPPRMVNVAQGKLLVLPPPTAPPPPPPPAANRDQIMLLLLLKLTQRLTEFAFSLNFNFDFDFNFGQTARAQEPLPQRRRISSTRPTRNESAVSGACAFQMTRARPQAQNKTTRQKMKKKYICIR